MKFKFRYIKMLGWVLSIVIVFLMLTGCKKFVDIGAPVTSSNAENVYTNDATAASVLTGIYITFSRSGISMNGELPSISAIGGLSADETFPTNTDVNANQYYTNSLLPIGPAGIFWINIYSVIYTTNSAIEGLTVSTTLTPAVKEQLLGEAKFIRALCYFYLVNLYGDVPLPVSTDYKINSLLPRAKTEMVYQQIVTDLKEAQTQLNARYVKANGLTITDERVRPTKFAATALLARVYLYLSDYINAESAATEIINNSAQYSLVNLDSVFLKNNSEAIWQLQSVGTESDANTKEGIFFIPPSATHYDAPVALTQTLLDNFESGDQRKIKWIKTKTVASVTYAFSFKYKIGQEITPSTEYSTVLRLAEQYLIRAEARIAKGNIADGIADLNVVRNRATDMSADIADRLPQYSTSITEPEAINAVALERQRELFTEWGHRWLDLKRTGRADAVLAPLKGDKWQTTDQLYPLPQIDIDKNPSLQGHQNAGY